MALVCLLTALAICGSWAGSFWGHGSERWNDHLAAAGGGLLFGISLFWLVPEVAETAGIARALLLAVGVAALLTVLDHALAHGGYSARQGVVWPLLLATVIHSMLDGWSVRLLSVQPWTNIAVTVGLALHKIPEGVAVAWVTRRSLNKPRKAFMLSGLAELFTLVGAWVEPGFNASGFARFGAWWSGGVMSVIAGGFLFLGVHAVLPAWKRRPVVFIFAATFLLVGGLTFLRSV